MNILNFIEQLSSAEIKNDNQSRKESLLAIGNFGKKFAMAAIPATLLAAIPKMSSAQGTSETVLQVLQFALTLEYLESTYYNTGLATNGLIVSADMPIFTQIAKHENDHVTFLQGAITAIGGTPNASPTFDFTAGGQFTPFTNYQQFLDLSQAFEDTGVRAYKGQAAYLQTNTAYLQAALQIHSVEARHACEVRRLRTAHGYDTIKGWITGASYGTLPAATAAVYTGEDNVTQDGANVSALGDGYGVNAATEAFDEPLTMAQVLSIAGAFIA